MFPPTPMPDDVSSIEASRDRMYWSSVLLTGRMMPGLQLATSRVEAANRQTRPLVVRDSRPTAQTQELVLSAANRVA
jgi:hypothetical protein